MPDPRSALVAATVAEYPQDRWIGYAFSQAVHHLRPMWLPAFRRGEIDFSGRRSGLAALLGQADARNLSADVRKLLKSDALGATASRNLLKTLISVGDEDDLRLALSFLVLLNINLAILNLLPVPVLDGGHILMSVVEWVRKKPVSMRLQEYTTTAFAILLLCFFLFVTLADVKRVPLLHEIFKRDTQIEQSSEPAQ